jgi:hypothetical protein
MSNSIWAFLCLFTAISAFHPHTIHSERRTYRHPADGLHRRGRFFHLEFPTSISSGFVNADIDTCMDTKAKDGSNHYRDLLGSFAADLDRLSVLRSPPKIRSFQQDRATRGYGHTHRGDGTQRKSNRRRLCLVLP